jgi:hypothetical protein
VYKGKILILPKSTNKSFINSHLLWKKYFSVIVLKSDICRKYFFLLQKYVGNIAVFAKQNCLPKGLGLQCVVL